MLWSQVSLDGNMPKIRKCVKWYVLSTEYAHLNSWAPLYKPYSAQTEAGTSCYWNARRTLHARISTSHTHTCHFVHFDEFWSSGKFSTRLYIVEPHQINWQQRRVRMLLLRWRPTGNNSLTWQCWWTRMLLERWRQTGSYSFFVALAKYDRLRQIEKRNGRNHDDIAQLQ